MVDFFVEFFFFSRFSTRLLHVFFLFLSFSRSPFLLLNSVSAPPSSSLTMVASSLHQGRALRSCSPCPAASTRRIAEAKASASIGHRRRRAITSMPPPRAENNNSNSGGDPQQPSGISEDVLARLRAAETEAAKLREQLAKVQVRRTEAFFPIRLVFFFELSRHRRRRCRPLLPPHPLPLRAPHPPPSSTPPLYRRLPNPPLRHPQHLLSRETASTETASPASRPSRPAPPRGPGSRSLRSSSSRAAASGRRRTEVPGGVTLLLRRRPPPW